MSLSLLYLKKIITSKSQISLWLLKLGGVRTCISIDALPYITRQKSLTDVVTNGQEKNV
jgi:hypothetical protein